MRSVAPLLRVRLAPLLIVSGFDSTSNVLPEGTVKAPVRLKLGGAPSSSGESCCVLLLPGSCGAL